MKSRTSPISMSHRDSLVFWDKLKSSLATEKELPALVLKQFIGKMQVPTTSLELLSCQTALKWREPLKKIHYVTYSVSHWCRLNHRKYQDMERDVKWSCSQLEYTSYCCTMNIDSAANMLCTNLDFIPQTKEQQEDHSQIKQNRAVTSRTSASLLNCLIT